MREDKAITLAVVVFIVVLVVGLFLAVKADLADLHACVESGRPAWECRALLRGGRP